jgi:signal peptidase II
MPRGKAAAFWPLMSVLVLADCGTKQLARDYLPLQHVPHSVIGDVVRFTLAYNPDAAFNLSLGPYSRWGFSLMAIAVLSVLGAVYRRTASDDRWQASALGLVSGGAIGNVLDRVRSPRGVVDFIDIGVGDVRFWTFNLADMGVTLGALLLVALLWHRGKSESNGPATHAAGARGRPVTSTRDEPS